MKISKFRPNLNLWFIIALALSFAFFNGCNNESSVSPVSQNGAYNTSVGVYPEGNSSDNTFSLTEVKFLLRKIELQSDINEKEEEEINLGPLVIKLDLFSKVTEFTFAKLNPGIYREIHFQLHKPSPNENISDPEFIESTNTRYSVIVRGFFNGIPFVYKTDVTVSKEVEFEENSVAVPVNGTVNITLRLSPYIWFLNNNVFMNPMDPVNKYMIDANIRNDFRRAFKDDNEDGEPD